jgi:hypothetical protein
MAADLNDDARAALIEECRTWIETVPSKDEGRFLGLSTLLHELEAEDELSEASLRWVEWLKGQVLGDLNTDLPRPRGETYELYEIREFMLSPRDLAHGLVLLDSLYRALGSNLDAEGEKSFMDYVRSLDKGQD